MNSRLVIGLGSISLLSALGAVVALPALAHEGHGKVETQGFDINAPRVVTPEAAALIGLQTVEVDFGEVVDVLRVTGIVRTQPDRARVLAPRIGGSIVSLRGRVGDRVAKGDALVEVASPEYLALRAELVQVEGQIRLLQVDGESSRERAAQAEVELGRVEENQGAVAANLLSEKRRAAIGARAEAQQKAIELESVRAGLDAKRKQIDILEQGDTSESRERGILTLFADIDGVVTDRVGVVGQGVDAGMSILQVADHSIVQVEGELPESMLARLDPTAAYSVRLRTDVDGEVVATGTVRYLSPIVDDVKRTARLVIDAENPAGILRAGMYVDASIVLREEKSAVVVPRGAILSDGSVSFVFVKEKDAFVKKDIHPGVGDDRVVEVLEGLAPGDVVVAHGAYSVMRVRPEPASAAAASPTADAKPAQPEPEHGSDGHKH